MHAFLAGSGHNAVALRRHEPALCEAVELLRYQRVDVDAFKQSFRCWTPGDVVGYGYFVVCRLVFVNASVVYVGVGLAVVKRAGIVDGGGVAQCVGVERKSQRAVAASVFLQVVCRVGLCVEHACVNVEECGVAQLESFSQRQ
ncbi:hypothetical protein EGR52_05310 [bacterium]|nr:hypothetical protein [bacterium]